MSKTTQLILKGATAALGLVAALMMLAPIIDYEVVTFNLFEMLDMQSEPIWYATVMTICYVAVFALGLLTAVLAILSMFIDNDIVNRILKIVVIALAVIVIVGFICNIIFVSEFKLPIGAVGIVSTIASIAAVGTVFANKFIK